METRPRYQDTLERITKPELVRRLAEIGYRINESDSFNYQSSGVASPVSWQPHPSRACYVVESDTGIGAFNIAARRDANFQKLQHEVRGDFLIAGRVYEV